MNDKTLKVARPVFIFHRYFIIVKDSWKNRSCHGMKKASMQYQ